MRVARRVYVLENGRVTTTGDGALNRWFYYNNVGLLTVRSCASDHLVREM